MISTIPTSVVIILLISSAVSPPVNPVMTATGGMAVSPEKEGERISILRYFPLRDGLIWKYSSNLGKVTSRVTAGGDQTTIITKSPPVNITQVLRLSPEGLYLTEAESDTFLLTTRRAYYPPLLRFPLRVTVGERWTWKGKEIVDGEIINSRVEGTIVGWERIMVPAGEFRCLKVTFTSISDDDTTGFSTQWLAAGVGIVKADIAVEASGLSGFIITLLGFDTYHLELTEMIKPRKSQ
ncbi:MAG: hypothetical protein RAO92_02360 [Candidatus Euphemobacter frigidus]|nr:hypothetical protein [Candidatus Euphemobacter frigidus]MDP8275226.1 hypothetical protein [Candidatus Euphemobacter frigidus]